jgi:hypothetical protein
MQSVAIAEPRRRILAAALDVYIKIAFTFDKCFKFNRAIFSHVAKLNVLHRTSVES